MLYSEIKREVLSRINQYSIAGAVIPGTYNNQADYLNRIPTFFNNGIVNVRTSTRRLSASVVLSEPSDYIGQMVLYTLPDDFYQLKTGGVSVVRDGRLTKTNQYRLSGRKNIMFPEEPGGDYVVEYYRYPELLPLDPPDRYDFDEDIDVIQCAITYAAAQLVLHDDEFVYASLYNDYVDRLNSITNGINVEVQTVEDAYDFNAGWC